MTVRKAGLPPRTDTETGHDPVLMHLDCLATFQNFLTIPELCGTIERN